MNFAITQANTAGNPIDVDFIAWGPFASPTCTATDLSIANQIGCSYSTSSFESFSIVNSLPGQYYMILITNFSNQAGQISLTQTNIGQAGAGTTDCSIVCTLTVTGGGIFCPRSSAKNECSISFINTFG